MGIHEALVATTGVAAPALCDTVDVLRFSLDVTVDEVGRSGTYYRRE